MQRIIFPIKKRHQLIDIFVFGLMSLCIKCCSINCYEISWCPQQCACYNGWSTVDCSKRDLTHIPQMPNSTLRLYLDSNSIEYLSDGTFSSTPLLVTLNLQSNKIIVIETTVFIGLDNLQTLNLSENQLISFKVQFTKSFHMKKLHTLDLSYNQLRTIPKNISYLAPNLQILILTNNLINSAWLDSSYKALSNIRKLDLSDNALKSIGLFYFDPLKKGSLEVLSMERCGVAHINKYALAGLNNLTYLSLQENPLLAANIADVLATLENATNLKHLVLRSLQLKDIGNNFFKHVPYLEILDISNCLLSTIHEGAFTYLQNLTNLFIEHNLLYSFNSTYSLPNLRILNISHNAIGHIAVRHLTMLQWLDISYNIIEHVPPHWLSQKESLYQIDLHHNLIQTIDKYAFAHACMHKLDISHNHLKVFGEYGLLKARIIDASFNRISEISVDSLIKVGVMLEELSLKHNRLQYLPSIEFPDFTTMQSIDFSENTFGPWLNTEPSCDFFKSFRHVQTLDFSHNNISVLPNNLTLKLSHLNSLILANNLITNVNDLKLTTLQSITTLDISNNLVEVFHSSSFASLQYLQSLDIRHNPFRCTCSQLPFINWLKSAHVIEHNYDSAGYKCVNPLSAKDSNLFTFSSQIINCDRSFFDADPKLIAVLVGSTFLITFVVSFAAYSNTICSHIKNLNYKWQSRYREVYDIEIA